MNVSTFREESPVLSQSESTKRWEVDRLLRSPTHLLRATEVSARACFVLKEKKINMAGDGDREMVLANFQVYLSSQCILGFVFSLTLFFCS